MHSPSPPVGLIGAVILVAASIFMYVPVDERVEKITAVLAGANCQGQVHAQGLIQGGDELFQKVLQQLDQDGDDQNEHDGLEVARPPPLWKEVTRNGEACSHLLYHDSG